MTTERPAPVLTVHAIDPGELEDIRRRGRDTAGNIPVPWPDATGFPLRCCLRPLQELLADPAVHEVHVRALAEQCFTYRVRAAGR
jgi:hypothetical protein